MFAVPDLKTALRVTTHHVCSACWEPLEYDDRSLVVSCHTEGCTCPGSISKRTADTLAQQQLDQARLAKHEMSAIPWLPQPKRESEDAILKALGF